MHQKERRVPWLDAMLWVFDAQREARFTLYGLVTYWIAWMCGIAVILTIFAPHLFSMVLIGAAIIYTATGWRYLTQRLRDLE